MKNQSRAIKTNLELYTVQGGYGWFRWLQETNRKKWWFFVTDKHTLHHNIYIIIINITTIANIIINNLERKTVLLLATGSSSSAAEFGGGINTRRGNKSTKSNQFMVDPFKARCQNNHKRIRTNRSHPPALQSLTGIDMKLGRDRLHENRRHLYCWRPLEHRGRINTMTKKMCQKHLILIYEKIENLII